MKHSIISTLAVLMGLTGCATTTSQKAMTVRLIRHSDPPASCKELGQVQGGHLFSVTEEDRLNTLREKTADLGGDTVRLDRRNADRLVFGTAFKCKKG